MRWHRRGFGGIIWEVVERRRNMRDDEMKADGDTAKRKAREDG
jgi:hypothetical protein